MACSARLKHAEQGGTARKIRDVENLFDERAKGLMLFTVEKQQIRTDLKMSQHLLL